MRSRPAGVTALAVAFVTIAAFLFAVGTLAIVGLVPLMLASSLLGGLETMGPLVFFLVGTVAGFTSFGLLRLHRWSRHAAAVLAVALLLGSVPLISAAVVDVRPLALIREGLKIILSIVAIRYLYDSNVKAAFVPEAPVDAGLSLSPPPLR